MRTPSRVIPEHILKLMPKDERKKLGKSGKLHNEIVEEKEAKNERELQGQIAALLRIHEITFFHQRMDKRTRGIVGWPDFTFALRGLPFVLEVKTKTGKLSPEQEALHVKLKKAGWYVYIIRDLEQLRIILKINGQLLDSHSD